MRDMLSGVDDIEQVRRKSSRGSGSSGRLKRVCFLQPQSKVMLTPDRSPSRWWYIHSYTCSSSSSRPIVGSTNFRPEKQLPLSLEYSVRWDGALHLSTGLLTSNLSCRDVLLPKALRIRLSTVRFLTCYASLQLLTIFRSIINYLECMACVLAAEANPMTKDSRARIESGRFLVAVVMRNA